LNKINKNSSECFALSRVFGLWSVCLSCVERLLRACLLVLIVTGLQMFCVVASAADKTDSEQKQSSDEKPSDEEKPSENRLMKRSR